MEVKIKKLNEHAVIPSYAKQGDAGMDITATSRYFDEYGNVVYGTGLAFEIPEGYVGLLFARSSVSKQDLCLANCVGVLDSGYRNEVFFKFKPTLAYTSNTELDEIDFSDIEIAGSKKCPIKHSIYEVGDRIGQIIIMPYPYIEFKEVNELSESERGLGGWGSTGK